MRHTPTLEVLDLTVAYRQRGEWLEAVRNFSLKIRPGETYGLVGESGSGKTTLAMSILRYLPQNGRVMGGAVRFEGRDLLKLKTAEMRRVWGRELGLVPQNPLSSLNPSMTLGEQMAEGLRQIEGLGRQTALQRSEQLLRMVRIPDPQRVLGLYPHQISGGMQQRVLIAMAVAPAPKLLVLDEPTTNLDATTQASILDLFGDLIQGMQTAALYVTHNLGVVARLCDRVAVMYAGELVEDAPLSDLFRQPLHPYTQALINSVPRLGENKKQVELQAIEGLPPALGPRIESCVFINRCPLAIDICRKRPPLYAIGRERQSRCHRWMELARGEVFTLQGLRRPALAASFDRGRHQPAQDAVGAVEAAPLLNLKDVSVTFEPRALLGSLFARGERLPVRAVNRINLQARRGRTLGIVGESGSGKSTLARAIAGLVERTGGDIQLMGVSLPAGLQGRDLDILRSLQMVFQNLEEAFNPYLTLGETLRRPFLNLMKLNPEQAELEVRKLLSAVRLPAEYAERLPRQLSGGERQRAAIARAIATRPALVLADEPVSALDVSVQASILNLLHDIQVEQGNTLLFISHDLAVVGYLADEIAVTYLGFLMEYSAADSLFQPPYHPYTEALLAAIPSVDPDAAREEDRLETRPEIRRELRLKGEIPSPTHIPSGCPFHTRCPRFLGDICVEQTPPWREDPATGKRYLCHIPVEALKAMQTPLV